MIRSLFGPPSLFSLILSVFTVLLLTGGFEKSPRPRYCCCFGVASVLFFVCAVNWTVSGRNILPLAPAAALLLVRRLKLPRSLPGKHVERAAAFKITAAAWISIQNFRAGAGYYSAVWGPAPFIFGPAPPETYQILRVK